jgi:hypothetical protein
MAVAPQFSFDLSTSTPFSMTTSRPAAMSAGVGLILISGIMPTHYTLATYSIHTQNRLKVYVLFTLKAIFGGKVPSIPKRKTLATDLITRVYK